MLSLRRMHEIVAADPRAQANFFLVMCELHYRFILGVERLLIGRTALARPLRSVQDDVASSLQPCIAPGTTDVQAPLKAQGRGFTHGRGKGHRVTPFIVTFGVDADVVDIERFTLLLVLLDGVINIRGSAHTRAGSMSLSLSHLNRACWLGGWPPLQISSH